MRKQKKPKKLRSKKSGLPPGSLVHIGEVKISPPVLSVFEYGATHLQERSLTADQIGQLHASPENKIWLNLHGVHDTGIIQKIGEKFGLHPLVMEDILNTEQRPKVDYFEHYLFLETRSFQYDKDLLDINSEQISIVLGRDFVLTFQERATGAFDPIRERLRADRGHIRSLGCDYLTYAFLDVIVDRYFGILEQMGDDCELLEDTLLTKPTNVLLHNLHQLKRASIELRRSVWPLREVINNLTRNENSFFSNHTLPYLRDVYDHTVHFIESLEAQRDMLGGMMDIYLSTVSNRVNLEVRALTVVAMLFMPATLIAGIFGMNFHEMPWIAEHNGFWWAMGLMALIALLMILIFWRRQWLSSKS